MTTFHSTGAMAGTKNSPSELRIACTMPANPSSTTVGIRIQVSCTVRCGTGPA